MEASNLWAFFQAKSIRRTVVQATSEQAKLSLGVMGDDAAKAALQKQIEDWTKTAARYRSEPETGEGSEELAKRAKHAEHERDLALAKYHHYEVASAAFQIGIVLASATIITGMMLLAWISGGTRDRRHRLYVDRLGRTACSAFDVDARAGEGAPLRPRAEPGPITTVLAARERLFASHSN